MISDDEKSKLQVGYKQAIRALNEDKASKVFIAEDSDNHMKDNMENLASQNRLFRESVIINKYK